MSTARLSPELLADAEIVGAHPEPEDAVVKDVPVTKVVRKSSKGVHTK